MAFLERKSVVSYRCSCGRLKPLSRAYFCRHCFLLRCEFCVSHEIDSRHCPTCLESLPVTDAWMKGNKCSNCLQCPMCQSNLTTRISNSKNNTESTPTKSYYLCCLFCHWSTRDIGMADSTTSANKWPELQNPHAERVAELVEYYKALSINDRMARDRKSHGARRPYSHISGISVAMVRQKAGLSVAGLPFQETKQLEVTRAIAGPAVDDLPEDIYTTKPDLTKVSSVEQRHRLPEVEPEDKSELRYFRKNLTGKRSQRCRSCEHNVIKPEFLPTSTKFKIQLSAYYLVPEVRIKSVEPLRAGAPCQLLLLLINPTQHPTTITLLPYDDPSSQAKPELVAVPVRDLALMLNARVEFPPLGISVPGRDDAAEFDEPSETPKFNDDPNVVAWRKANKVVARLVVIPDSQLPVGSEVILGLTLSHIYTNTVIMHEKKQLNPIQHSFKLVLQLGHVIGS